MISKTYNLQPWTGNMDELARKASEVLRAQGSEDAEPYSVRPMRDYLQRGLLGQASWTGKELSFVYANLLRFVPTRVLLRGG